MYVKAYLNRGPGGRSGQDQGKVGVDRLRWALLFEAIRALKMAKPTAYRDTYGLMNRGPAAVSAIAVVVSKEAQSKPTRCVLMQPIAVSACIPTAGS